MSNQTLSQAKTSPEPITEIPESSRELGKRIEKLRLELSQLRRKLEETDYMVAGEKRDNLLRKISKTQDKLEMNLEAYDDPQRYETHALMTIAKLFKADIAHAEKIPEDEIKGGYRVSQNKYHILSKEKDDNGKQKVVATLPFYEAMEELKKMPQEKQTKEIREMPVEVKGYEDKKILDIIERNKNRLIAEAMTHQVGYSSYEDLSRKKVIELQVSALRYDKGLSIGAKKTSIDDNDGLWGSSSFAHKWEDIEKILGEKDTKEIKKILDTKAREIQKRNEEGYWREESRVFNNIGMIRLVHTELNGDRDVIFHTVEELDAYFAKNIYDIPKAGEGYHKTQMEIEISNEEGDNFLLLPRLDISESLHDFDPSRTNASTYISSMYMDGDEPKELTSEIGVNVYVDMKTAFATMTPKIADGERKDMGETETQDQKVSQGKKNPKAKGNRPKPELKP